MTYTIKLNIPETAEERVRREESRKLAMELVEPIQEAAARLFEMYLKEAIDPLKARIRQLEAARADCTAPDDDAIYAMSLDDLREFAIKARDELEEARSGWLNEKTERQGCEARLKEAEKNWHAAERESEAIYTVAWTLYKALDGLIHATKNPGDGGSFEAGELPELDTARQAVAEFRGMVMPDGSKTGD